MKEISLNATPLITHDPYFSIWSNSMNLNDGDLIHWSGEKQIIRGFLYIDGIKYCFLGERANCRRMEQTGLKISATSTTYEFQTGTTKLTVSFLSPLLLDDLDILTRPLSYIFIKVEGDKEYRLEFNLSATLTSRELIPAFHHSTTNGELGNIKYHSSSNEGFTYLMFGKDQQTPLCHTADLSTIDWGYLFFASIEKMVCERIGEWITASLTLEKDKETIFTLSYDDIVSVNYFGDLLKGLWTEKFNNPLSLIKTAFAECTEIRAKCEAFDKQFEKEALNCGDEDYLTLCIASYRQSIAAHKLVRDNNGEILFLSKENNSNGCIGTLDVTYPSTPLYFLYNRELVKGMLRPIFKMATSPVWPYDFAPHDVGRYPYATGQVYGMVNQRKGRTVTNTALPIWYFNAKDELYELHRQMPIEENGNLLILLAALAIEDNSAEFSAPYVELLRIYTEYLIEKGLDPEEQLCTDDFAGHLSRNANLAVKAILGIEAFSIILRYLKDEEGSVTYHKIAVKAAKEWEEKAKGKYSTVLAFGNEESWSLKYNLLWDRYFGSNLFTNELFENEIDFYISKINTYGVPLDSRRTYTKSDWILWCSALTDDKEKRAKLIAPVAKYATSSVTKIPFGDFYETDTSRSCGMIARSVQGGIFAPLMLDKKNKK